MHVHRCVVSLERSMNFRVTIIRIKIVLHLPSMSISVQDKYVSSDLQFPGKIQIKGWFWCDTWEKVTALFQ